MFVLLASVIISCDLKKTKPERLNILWLVADDLGNDLRCYGEEAVRTPHLDQLAREGIRYSNLFTVTAVCSPSRSALITGMYPVSINSHQHRTRNKKPLPDPVVPVTYLFREAGYFTANGSVRDLDEPGKEDYNFIADSLFDGTDWRDREEGQPFFAQVQVNWPHRPFMRDSINPVDNKKVNVPPYYPDHPITREDWAMYLETIQLMDAQVGFVLERLDKDGLKDKTVVFFFGDQGRPMPRAKQFMYDPGINTPLLILGLPDSLADQGFGVNNDLISNIDIPATSLMLAGIEIPGWMQGRNFLDDNNTREYIFAMRDRRDETEDRIRAVRSDQYKYIRNFYPDRPYTQYNSYKERRYPILTLMHIYRKQGQLNENQLSFMAGKKPSEELYHLTNDPHELKNLAQDTVYNDVVRTMRTQLDQWLNKYDLGGYPEDSAEIIFWRNQANKKLASQMLEYGLDSTASHIELLGYWEKILLEND